MTKTSLTTADTSTADINSDRSSALRHTAVLAVAGVAAVIVAPTLLHLLNAAIEPFSQIQNYSPVELIQMITGTFHGAANQG